ncbi:hypothetical protein IX84_20725 [Phaeodactylibacter xiamenensis]|uniref:histidine kinase n=2 Tax=Phaeodactylibacter xiamenensis TaxID=1524460 RepID=A0A098S2I0_9BACT|nr:hypothetical protein IX84_20725 [Phaeodactylibacter xiamenensis]
MKEMVEDVSLYLTADEMELQPEKISTETLTNDIFNQLKHYYPDLLKRYRFTIQSPLPDCYFDPLLFRQVMTNLLSNAVKATRSVDHPQIQVTGQKKDGTVILAVKDNGIGIPLQNRERLFELFKSVHTRDRFPGTGAGLAIVKRIMERHEGSVSVESMGEGRGTTFTLRFPLP